MTTIDDVISGAAQWSLFHGSCLDMLRAMPDCCVDSCVTDPPYELSSDGKAGACGVFSKFMFPEKTKIKSDFPEDNCLSFLIGKILDLCSVRGIPGPSTAMEVAPVALDSEPSRRDDNINDVSVLAALTPNSDGPDDKEPEPSEYIGCFFLENTNAASMAESFNCSGCGFFSGGIGVGLRIDASCFPGLLEGTGVINDSDPAIRRNNDSLSPFVGTGRGAENFSVPIIGMARGSNETLSATEALVLLRTVELGGAKLIRTSSSACSLPSVFEPRRVRVISDSTNRAISFDLVVHPQSVASSGFMGKEWDGSKIAFSIELWRECLRVLKPGGHLLAFGGTRTHHRMTCSIEDAGFEVRDEIDWIYGSGFPKSLNVSKAIDKHFGAERKVLGVSGASGSTRNSMAGNFKGGEYMTTEAATEAATEAEGIGTALKPAHEPVVVARKPLIGTVAANYLAHGTGGINIDACRVPRNAAAERGEAWAKSGNSAKPSADKIAAPPGNGINQNAKGGWPANVVFTHAAGCGTECVDGCPCKELGEMSGESESSDAIRKCNPYTGPSTPCGKGKARETAGISDSGTAARYFNQSRWSEQDDESWPGFYYCSKASTAERELGCDALQKRVAHELTDREAETAGLNNPRAGAGRTSDGRANFHPTVKPLELMRWLARLVTPKGGIILEPFGGSGTTPMAAILEGFRCIVSELTEEHCPIIEARVAWAERQRKLDTRQLSLFEVP